MIPQWLYEINAAFSYAITDGINMRGREDYQVLQALNIAWDALEYGFNGRTIKESGMSVQERPLTKSEIQLSLLEAMKKIEELKG